LSEHPPGRLEHLPLAYPPGDPGPGRALDRRLSLALRSSHSSGVYLW
ncbi:MAG: hypothetical protein QOE27_2574, partial [Solirubrobacteraceae bacterium]|nr:hypothetical protein [Solirubrobacteraceae bacterium]